MQHYRLKYGNAEVPLPARHFRIGRGRDVDLRLADSAVSRVHATTTISDDGQVYIRDTSSTNGVFIDGQLCRDWTAVSMGSEIVLGTIAIHLVGERGWSEPPPGLEGEAEESGMSAPTDVVVRRRRRRTTGSDGPIVQLSPREVEVLRHIAQGKTIREAAESVGVSIKTIETYVRRVREKTGARSRIELVDIARTHPDILVS